MAAKFERQRQELATVLASGIFNRAPSLAMLLIYICEKYFEGEAGQIKEYNIAVEALGRPAEFDQKRDSIVRVEAHRLRKRLKEYYDSTGSQHDVQIIIPAGQYAPQFRIHEASGQFSKQPPAPPPFEARPMSTPGFRPRRVYTALGVLFLTIAAVLAGQYTRVLNHVSATEVLAADDPAPAGEEVRMLAGSATSYTDHFGRKWEPDHWFEGGSTFQSADHTITGTRDPALYQTGRRGSFRYDIPLKKGTYELRLHFAETTFGDGNPSGGGEASRLFNVVANGKQLLEMIDVIADAGPNAADVRVFKDIRAAADGYLHLECKPVVDAAFLNAIEISPGTPGRLRPIRIVARDQPYIDKRGRMWAADRYFQGGQLVVRSTLVAGTSEPEIYRGERFGNITYAIPVAPGQYTVIVHFAETWFGPGKQPGGGAGSRSFDLLCNGVALFREMDIFKEAGGADRAYQRLFHGLEANPQGKLVLSFVPHRNYSCINAIEVLDDGPRM